MSVEGPRLAAAQRTAATPRRVRAFRLASWLLIVPTLSFFSFSVVANASGFGAKPRYSDAVRDVAPKRAERGAFLVVKESANPIEKIIAGAAQEVCWINSSQLARVAQRWPTGRMTISYRGRPLDLVTVGGARERDLRAELGDAHCVLVQVSRTFFLPFEAHGS
jgi:hypothetical protein